MKSSGKFFRERLLGGARVTEHRRQPQRPKQFDGDLMDSFLICHDFADPFQHHAPPSATLTVEAGFSNGAHDKINRWRLSLETSTVGRIVFRQLRVHSN